MLCSITALPVNFFREFTNNLHLLNNSSYVVIYSFSHATSAMIGLIEEIAMGTITFLINGAITGLANITAWVTIEEKANGSLFFKVKQAGDSMGQVHGLYFDVMDASIHNTLRVNALACDELASEEAVDCLKNGTNTGTSLVCSKESSVGAHRLPQDNAGRSIYSYSFALSSSVRALALSDFSQIKVDYSGTADRIEGESYDDNSHRWLYMGLK